MRTVSLFLYKFHFKIVAFVLRVRTRHDGSVSEFLLPFVITVTVAVGWYDSAAMRTAAKYLAHSKVCVCVCVR